MEIILIGVALLVLLLLLAVVVLLVLWSEARRRALTAEARAILQAKEYLVKREKEIRADAIARSEVTVRGKVSEQLAPFAESFGYDPRDCRFLGSPIDFIVFEGLSEGSLDRVVFIEVKTGLSRLSSRERQVRGIVEEGEVYFEEMLI